MAAHTAYLSELLGLGDPAMASLVDAEVPALEAGLARLRARAAGPDDGKPAFLTISSGSGGREAMDWARMLLRMYDKALHKMGLEHECAYLDATDDGGIRTVTLRVLGASYGRLRGESGVHRLSRVSPFDQADRRQTSFAKVEVIPESEAKVLDVDVDVDVEEEDIETKACRGGGPGGQAINKKASVIMMKHKPTGIVVRCQDGRSQNHNRQVALALLKSKLAKIARDEADRKDAKKRSESPRATFGAKYRRTYVLSQHPMIHDHVTGVECQRTQSVLDGDLGLLEG
jgi:peptide chain release factor 2